MLKIQLAKFNQLMQGIEKIYEDYAKFVGLTYMSLSVLQIVYYAETPCTQKDICGICHYNKQVVNSIIKGFYDKGYISFEEASNDRRNKFVLLSKSGKKYADDIMAPLWEIEKTALSVFGDGEREQLLDMLERCYEGYKCAYNNQLNTV